MITCKDIPGEFPACHNYIHGISRGGLLHPNSVTAAIIMYNYIVLNKLTQSPIFTKAINKRSLTTQITLNILADDDVWSRYLL